MIRLALVVAAALLAGNGPEQQGVAWMKLEQARVVAAKSGRGITVLVACDPKSGMVACGRSTGTEKVFGDPAMERWKEKFVFARVADKKGAEELKATKPLEILYLAADGDEVHRSAFLDLAALEKDLAVATKRITPRAPDWATVDFKQPAAEGAKPIVLFLTDDRKDSLDTLKALESAEVAPFHERVVFVRHAWKKDSEEAKKYGAAQAPMVLVLDGSTREPIEKAAGKKTARELKALIQKALAKK
jgi:hypothetical protein